MTWLREQYNINLGDTRTKGVDMATIKLVVVTELRKPTRSILAGKAPFFVGQGDTDLVCGSCGSILAEGIVNGQIRDLILKCPECGEYCEQTLLPPFPEVQVIRLSAGYFDFSTLSAPIKCPPDVAVIGTKLSVP